MKNSIKTFWLLLLISFNVSAQTPAATIPDFRLFRPDKTVFTNRNLVPGKMSFFIFFDAGCDHCQRAMSHLSQHYDAYKKAAIYLVTMDAPATTDYFMREYAPNLPGKKNITMLRDLQYEFIKKFKPRKYPSMLLYSAEKKLILYEDDEGNMSKFVKLIK